MLRAAGVLLLPLLLLSPAATAAPQVSGAALDCVDPAELVACVEGTVTGTFECQRFDAERVSCWANATWTYRGFTNLPAVVAGDANRAGGLNVEWCDIGGLCRGVGVGLLIVGCTYLPGQPCGGTFQHSMWLGTPKIGPGQCIDFTFTPWVYVWGDIQPGAVSDVAGRVVNGDSGPLLRAEANPSVVDHVCN